MPALQGFGSDSSNSDSGSFKDVSASGPQPDSSRGTGSRGDYLTAGAAALLYQPLDADLTALAALSTTGIVARIAANTYALRTLTAPAAGLSITNPDGVSGNPTFALANDLDALEALSTTGYAKRTGTDTWSLSSSIPWSDVSSTPTTLADYGITDAQPLDSDLTAIAALSTTSYGRSVLTLADAAAAQSLFGVRAVLTATRTYYVRTDGSDSNTGLSNTAGGAFLTIQHALDVASSLDCVTYSVTISVQAGTYTVTTPINLPVMLGSGTMTLQGDTTTPANVVITNATAATSVLRGLGCTPWTIEGFKITNSGTGASDGLIFNNCKIKIGNCEFGAITRFAFLLTGLVYMDFTTTVKISGSMAAFIFCQRGSHSVAAVATWTISGTPAFSSWFVNSFDVSTAQFSGVTFSGSATGVRYSVSQNAVVDTGGGGATFLPGNSAGSAVTGGQYV